MYTCMYVYTYTYMYTYICIYINMHIYIYMYIHFYIHINIKKLPALHRFVARVVFCTARHCPWQAKNPHCTELHEPAGKATMHGFARKTRKWSPSSKDLHGTTCTVPIHMDPNLALLMKLNLAQRSPWQA